MNLVHIISLVLAMGSPDLKELEAAADGLYTSGGFSAAALEYKRLIFYASGSDSGDVLDPVRIKLGLALYRNGEKEEADSVLYSLESPVARMVRAVVLIEQGNPYLAAREIDSATCAEMGKTAYRLRGWAYLEAREFSKAAGEFKKAGEDELAQKVGELREIKLKNPRTARWLSLLPGLGEAYARRPWFGLWALSVNSGTTYLLASSIVGKQFVDAVLIYAFLWQRFYAGSMNNADRFAKQYNREQYRKALEPIRGGFGEADALSLELEALNRLHQLADSSSYR